MKKNCQRPDGENAACSEKARTVNGDPGLFYFGVETQQGIGTTRKMNRTKVTLKKKKLVLDVIRKTANVTLAAEVNNISRRRLYEERERDAEFAAAWDEAIECAVDDLEHEARRRALDGWDEPQFGRVAKDQDGEIGVVRKFSDTLLIFLLKGRRKGVFSERTELVGKDGAPLIVNLVNYDDNNTAV